MQRKQLKNLKKSIDKIWRMFEGKKRKKEHSEEGNYQKGLW